ncbi:MAG: hypothetical protein AAFR65_05870 [Pseudomonadota bacterium]
MIELVEASWLRVAYAANIVILVPVCFGMFAGGGVNTVFEGKVPESQGLRLLVGSLWLAILLSSAAGLFWPAVLLPVILIQIIYKSTWLLTYVVPAIRSGGLKQVPWGITMTFILIVATYPVLVWLAAT